MSTRRTKRGRPANPELDAKVAIALALEGVFGCSAIEAARMTAQAEPGRFAAALRTTPVDPDLLLEAIGKGAFAITEKLAASEAAIATTLSARAFPATESGDVSRDQERRRAARFRKLLHDNAESARQDHPLALDIEREAQAILQGIKTRRARDAVDTELVDTLQRALIAIDEHDDSSEPWTLG